VTVDELRIPDYVDITALGQGGSATVYRARHQIFQRSVAIKVLDLAGDERQLRTFEQECAAVGSLSGHPHIVTVYETGQLEDGRRFIVMELFPNGSLADQLSHVGVMAAEDVVEVGIKLAGALESAHRSAIVHGDVKPDNVLLSGHGEPKLADFGIATIRGEGVDRPGETSATLLHAAPEVIEGGRASVAGDIYSLCSTLYTLLSGRPPFTGEQGTSLVGQVAQITLQPPPDLRSAGVPGPLWDVLAQGLSKAPGNRQADAAQLGRQLQAVQLALGRPVTRVPIEVVHPGDPPASVASGRRRPARTRLWHAAPKRAIVVVAVGAAVAIAAFTIPRIVQRPASLDLLYQDNFDGGQSWYEHEDDNGFLRYDMGQYRMAVDPPNHVLLSDTSFRGGSYGEPLTGLADVSVRVTVMSASPSSVLGVFCRNKPEGYYQAVIRTDGSALLVKTTPQGLVTLGDATVPFPTAGPTTIRLDCLGRRTARLALFVGDKKVISATDSAPFKSGSVGMVVASESTRTDVRFDDFALYGRRAGS
jgi:hypothetical protein